MRYWHIILALVLSLLINSCLDDASANRDQDSGKTKTRQQQQKQQKPCKT